MNIRTVRKKIKSVSNVKKITKAMELVSAIKMKKAQQKALESAPYRKSLERIIYKATAGLEKGFSPLIETTSQSNKNLYLVISSSKGLCGSFNFNLLRYLGKEISFKDNDFIIIGKKASSFINKMGGAIIADFSHVEPENAISAIFTEALEKYLSGQYRQVVLLYNRFINTLKFETTATCLLPAKLSEKLVNQETDTVVESEYLIEPSAKEIIDAVLKNLIEEKIRGAIIDSEAAEHSSRMVAMKNATDNAENVIYNLTLLRNKIRQEKITYELLDMLTAKESVESN
ncbi:ATP synthase F1 subunit gamma [Candidatus Roizmanbacteria bacterium CG22_combo_CG10-13_8_21_14_all_35_9]|uniref:ATP synthase gamma chain n=3 Tax=Candidatus Roizmaniibacteriota TaxID=1752723 RepID=A0A2M8F3R0_9BACT|nr:MAG: ATP synthase F1 subunit gamma [Candidatus Roizmanbacteria bacterium CG22_combo_CG10-13_8_21_14_all_35_9]PIY70721.1 MAG: ATP synthase F1 subunit gamma [Candidatus Roizmanbacteria bacterium CG_4_10_14_0_8_um_filter_35_28]PJC33915.1 MAG: ATP synthase F1 subunit gamma [Candidatus Roizmanbacteria bacterium CG_4_9_14_0_2_um_filter_35_15]PJC83198.1 MAG: ATP synthase F1 subunit gamma [Candidatus Roizmanbacteria bacterium CG_4_8_14_3_um_filter_35_14]